MPFWLKVLYIFLKSEDPAHSFIQQNCVNDLPGPWMKLDTSKTEMNDACSVLKILMVHSAG